MSHRYETYMAMTRRDPTTSPLLSIVIPLFHEGEHLARVLHGVRSAIAELDGRYEFILVDDGSLDNTWEIISKEAETRGDILGLRLSRNFGKEAALSAGLEASTGRAVVIMDGDLQHPPELIPEMLRIWQAGGCDIVEAIKRNRGKESLRNRIGSTLFYTVLNRLSGFDLRNASDYKLMDRKVVEAWRRMGEHNLFFRGMSLWLGFRRTQIPFEVPTRVGGVSKWGLLGLIRLAVIAITSFSSLPLQLVTVLGSLFFLFAFVMGLQTLFVWFTGRAVSGFTTTILLLLLIGSLLMISLGIIGEYIARIYDEVKARPRYVISEDTEGQ